MRPALMLFLALILLAGNGTAQEAFDWQTHSSKKNITDASFSRNGIWAGTEGGAFYFDISDSAYYTLTKTEGLDGSGISAVFVDDQGSVWFGNQNGTIDIINRSAKTKHRIFDIFSSNNSTKQIYDFEQKGDTIFVSTDFGITLVHRTSFRIIDTFSKLGSFSSKIKIRQTLNRDRIFAATEFGVAMQIPGTTNLTAPESWQNFTTAQGLLSASVVELGIFRDTLIAATAAGISYFNGTSWSDFLSFFRNKSVLDIYIKGDSLYILQGDRLYLYENGRITEPFNLLFTNTARIIYISDYGYFAHKSGILRVPYTSFNIAYLFPEGPAANQFLNLDIDNSGNLWVATGKDVAGIGTFKYDGFSWQNINTSTTSGFPSNSVYNVNGGGDNNVYLSTWGAGMIRMSNNGSIAHFTAANTPMRGISANYNYLVIADTKTDSRNNVWILNHDAANQKTLAALTPDSTWHLFANYSDSSLAQYSKLVIDQFDTKWFLCADPSRVGLFYFNENKTFGIKTDDRYGYLSNLSELYGKTINDLVIDQRGDLWLGTNLGVFYISNLYSFVSLAQPSVRVNSVFSLRQYSVNCMAVDPLNRKWIGTNQGLLLMSSDGGTLITYFDSKNSPLLSDEIRSIAIDNKSGKVYVGLDGGLSVFSTYAQEPAASLDNLALYPSPFILSENSPHLTIDGLVKESELKVITLSGKVVRTIITPGGRVANWNGKDDDGKDVSTGVYIIVAYDKDGNNISSQKIAVIRK